MPRLKSWLGHYKLCEVQQVTQSHYPYGDKLVLPDRVAVTLKEVKKKVLSTVPSTLAASAVIALYAI